MNVCDYSNCERRKVIVHFHSLHWWYDSLPW